MIFELGEHCRGAVATDAEAVAGTFSIGGGHLRVTVSELVVWRDAYVTQDAPAFIKSPNWQLGSQQYFVLGDNSPVSRDSRQYAAISRADLVGFVRRFDP